MGTWVWLLGLGASTWSAIRPYVLVLEHVEDVGHALTSIREHQICTCDLTGTANEAYAQHKSTRLRARTALAHT